jgi:hypothetical protein
VVVDVTDARRAVLATALNATGIPEAYKGQVWDTAEMQEDFEVLGFMAPYVVVRRRSDGVKGTLMFTHSPRFYFRFEAAA